MKLLQMTLLGLSAFSVIGSGWANQATFVNQSAVPIKIVYQAAHKNVGQQTVMGPEQTVTVSNTAPINFSLEGYQLAGVVPVSINGVKLPHSVTEFDMPQRCSLTTDAAKNNGKIRLQFVDTHPRHLDCGIDGGIFN